MIQDLMEEFKDTAIDVQYITISELLDEFLYLYKNNQLSQLEQLECLGFINTLFKLKHKYIVNFNKEKRTFTRDTQMFHLRKIQRIAQQKIKKTSTRTYKKYEPSEQVLEFRSLIKALNKKIKNDLQEKTKRLLEELMNERWTVQEKSSLLKQLVDKNEAKFQDLLESEDVEEIITSFLALLDMKRKNEVKVIQKRNFGQIIIQKEVNN